MENRINELINIINQANIDYYIKDNPLITDQEYDKYLRELIELEEKYPKLKQKDSPTNKIGAKISSNKISHKNPMMSLSNVFNEEELIEFDKRIKKEIIKPEYVLELKIDGLAISLIYEQGILVKGVTRGDGFTGEDITENVKTIKDIPKVLTEKVDIDVRGEVYMSKDVFSSINNEKIAKGEEKFANPRNAAAGSLRQLDVNLVKKRNLSNFAYHLIDDKSNFTNHYENLVYLKKLGFNVNENIKVTSNIKDIIKFINNATIERNNLPYEIDGVVIKLNNLFDQKKIGYTSRYPKWATAYKFPSEIALTKLLDIKFSVGRTGQITPNAILEPVILMGSTIAKATLHNEDYIKLKDIRKGDVVAITKAGDIIPAVLEPIKERRIGIEQEFIMIDRCPICETLISKIKESSAYFCLNSNCSARKIESLLHYVGRKAMNIEGLGESIMEDFYNMQYVTKVEDLYNLYNYKDQIMSLEGFGNKKINNLLNNIEKSKTNSLEKLLFALGIRHLGEKSSKIIANEFLDIEKLFYVKKEDLINIDNIGEIISLSIEEYFNNDINIQTIKKLISFGVNTKYLGKKEIDPNFDAKTFVITGTLENFTREKLENIIESKNGNVSKSVSKKTDVLIYGQNTGSKFDKAKSLNIELWDEKDLIKKI